MNTIKRWVWNLPDSALVNFIFGMGFFVLAGLALLAISYALMFTWTVHPLAVVVWAWPLYKFGRWFAEK